MDTSSLLNDAILWSDLMAGYDAGHALRYMPLFILPFYKEFQ